MQELTINEHLVKISSGLMVTDKPLKLGDDVAILVKGTVTKIEQRDNNDGTFDQIYVVKGVIGEALDEQPY